MEVVVADPLFENEDKSMSAIVDWFDLKKGKFYKLGQSYLLDIHDIEDVFYKTIVKIHNEKRKRKNNMNFEKWVLSIFITECREVSKNKVEKLDNNENRESSIEDRLYKLDDIYKEPIVFKYLIGLPQDEVAQLIQVPIQDINTRLLKGFQLLTRDKLDQEHVSCDGYTRHFIDYLGLNLNRRDKVDLEIHLHTCQNCQNELALIQDVILYFGRVTDTADVPPTVMKSVRGRVIETEERRKQVVKKRIVVSSVIASILAIGIFIGFVTNGFAYLYYSYQDWRNLEDEQLLTYLKHGIAEPLYLEQESNGVKITIKSVVADEFQTLLYYEIEDLETNHHYMINNYEGFTIENEEDLLNHMSYQMQYFPFEELETKSKASNIFEGKVSVLPIYPESGTIKLNISRLLKIAEGDNVIDVINATHSNNEIVAGEWNFEIPVTKTASIEHELDKKVEIEGIPLHFTKIVFAPTTTMLRYRYEILQESSMHVGEVHFDSIKTENQEAKVDLYGNIHHNSSGNGEWITMQTSFEPLYFEEPQNLEIDIEGMELYIQDNKTFTVNPYGVFPQTFKYQGNTISVDNITIGNPAIITFTEAKPEVRNYNMLHYQFLTDKDGQALSMGYRDNEGVYMDSDGKIYKQDEYQFNGWERVRFYPTKTEMELINDFGDEDVIPTKLEIHGYNTVKYTNESIKVSLD
ncbi:DUF4179 domain-containing protein [Fredinandcohnia sp. 179-A 10B2 NHS]|uniref:DUF4179 domain-containing protein n=1 Tax=Fredinandcohnia sp. 179-A 10B2 NHS TaxID=3235176 RepID=UPI0039A15C25